MSRGRKHERGVNAMTDPGRRRKREEDYADRLPDWPDRDGDDAEAQDAREETYRDGSVRHECSSEP